MDHPIPNPGQLRRPDRTVPAGAVVTAAIVELAPPGGAGADGRIVAAAAMIDGEVVHRSVTVVGADAAADVCGFDAFAEIYRIAQGREATVLAYIAGTGLRAVLTGAGAEAGLPGVRVVPGLHGAEGVRLRPVFACARDAGAAELARFDAVLELERERREAQARAEAARHRDVYTDGSVSATRIGCGAAAVGDDGRVHTRVVEDLPNRPVLAELLAIELALHTYPNRRLTVHTDSRDAIRLVTADPDRRSLSRESAVVVRRARAIARRVDELGLGRRIRLVWIQGHTGHPFNEAADRAAKAARRTRSFRMDSVALDVVLGNIDQDLRPLVA